ncbi:UNVERIFIED_CONTAM: GDSL esterase/lipase [Sesamum latifolium]|uniref:GDSL esterase/lipase n=1 Tax=Sesamum latifolium TaxID=2727402 RepID=A0AAW2WMC9_9LAMI
MKMGVAYAIILILVASISTQASGCYDSIISFGDSLADTGNLRLLSPPNNPPLCARPPYGLTFFNLSTGRASDGRLLRVWAAVGGAVRALEALRRRKAGFSKGVRWGGGATALDDAKFFDQRGIQKLATNASLGIQLEWFKQFLARIPANFSL